MITLSVCNDELKTARLFKENDLEQNENSLCLIASDKSNDLGFCLFDLTGETIVIRYIEPLNDLSLADGILRSTLHVGCERFVMDAYYSENIPESFFEKLGFIKEKQKRTLNVDKLFMSCNSCGKEG